MNIILSGSVAYDYLMTFPGYFKDHILSEHLEHISLSFLVDSMVKRRGGVSPNIAYTMALLGEKPRIMATVGEDFEEYRNFLEELGVDTSEMHIIPGEFTASFFVNTDRSNAQIASFYPGAMAYAAQLSFHNIRNSKPELVVISPNAPEAMKQNVIECQELNIPYFYDPSQQIIRLDGKDLQQGVEGALALFSNDYEFELIQKRSRLTKDEIIEKTMFTVVTHGEGGAKIYTENETYNIPIVHPTEIIDPTGVGDAFRGGFLTGYGHNMGWEICGQIGALAATYCLETDGPQSHRYTINQFITRYRKYFDDEGALKVLDTGY